MKLTLVLSAAMLLLPAWAQETAKQKADRAGDKAAAAADNAAAKTRDTANRATTDKDVTHGRIKELVPGQKVVIDVDNAPDKEFEMKDVKVNMAKNLKVGDPVMVKETEKMGKTTAVTITKHTGGGVKHGDKDATGQKQ